MLNDAAERLAYYRRIIAEALAEEKDGCGGELLGWSCQRGPRR
jgi:hypothetical protein